MGALVALLVLAWLVARSETPQMTIKPSRAAPGHTVTVEFKESQYPGVALTLERGGQVFLLENDRLSELDDREEPDPQSKLDPSSDRPSQSDLDFLSKFDVAIGLASTRGLLLSDGSESSRVTFMTSYSTLTFPVPSSSIWQVTLPYELERGTYRVCTLPREPRTRVCAPLTVGFGD
jgi:hypothetical protein